MLPVTFRPFPGGPRYKARKYPNLPHVIGQHQRSPVPGRKRPGFPDPSYIGVSSRPLLATYCSFLTGFRTDESGTEQLLKHPAQLTWVPGKKKKSGITWASRLAHRLTAGDGSWYCWSSATMQNILYKSCTADSIRTQDGKDTPAFSCPEQPRIYSP